MSGTCGNRLYYITSQSYLLFFGKEPANITEPRETPVRSSKTKQNNMHLCCIHIDERCQQTKMLAPFLRSKASVYFRLGSPFMMSHPKNNNNKTTHSIRAETKTTTAGVNDHSVKVLHVAVGPSCKDFCHVLSCFPSEAKEDVIILQLYVKLPTNKPTRREAYKNSV